MSFDRRAATWDASDRRQRLAQAVYEGIGQTLSLDRRMHLLDIGAGTGLLSGRLLKDVGAVDAVDSSEGMLAQLTARYPQIRTFQTDIFAFEPPCAYDGVVSSMTLHHIPDPEALFRKIRDWLRPGGFMAIADLEQEDGTFHDRGNDGVYHFGFDPEVLVRMAARSGFDAPAVRRIHTVRKGGDRLYPIFLLTARWGG